MFARNLINKAVALTSVLMMSGVCPSAQDRDVQSATLAIRTRAIAGDVVAQHTLASLLYYGTDDLAQAIDWLRKAAAQGYADAEFELGQVHDFGFGVPANVAEALVWYRRAAEHGSAAAHRALGDQYRRGRGVPMDHVEAGRHYQRAAERDDLRAQVQLGQAHLNGDGVPRDYQQAYFWFAVAAQQTPLPDNQKALIEMRNIAAARLTPEDEAQATRRVAEWSPPPFIR